MANTIVTVNVSEQVASAPSTLQRTAAFISQGATSGAAGVPQLLTAPGDFTPRPPVAIQSATWTGGTVTVQTTAAHGIPAGGSVAGVIAGMVPPAYDGNFQVTEVDATHFTYPLASNPGAESTLGTFNFASVSELQADVNSWFGQGSSQAVYVLELGPGTPAAGVTALTAYLLNPVVRMYRYLFPKLWDTEATALNLAKQYGSTTAEQYFDVQTTLATYTTWSALPVKAAMLWIESPDAPVTESSAAGAMYPMVATNPGPVNLVAPLANRFVSGLTPYATLTGPEITALKAAGVNWIGTGAEGGISNTLIVNGKTGDLKPWNYWYSVDWQIVNQSLGLAGAVIDGANDPTNPLYYNQPGINRLQVRSQSVYARSVNFGLSQPGGVVTAIPFIEYTTDNPGDYAIGEYAGLALTFVPLRGFEHITLNLVASDIITA